MKKNKIGTLFLVSVLALAGIGITYAGWTDIITVSGTVQTGSVDFSVESYTGTWVWKHYADASGMPMHEKEVHNGVVDVDDEDIDGFLNDDPNGYYDNPDEWELVARSYCYEDDATAQDINFKFDNLFPCVYFYADFEFKIVSVPVHLQGVLFNWDSMNPVGWLDNADVDWGWQVYDITNDQVIYDSNDGTFDVDNGIIQLHPGIDYYWKLYIHVPQNNDYQKASASGSAQMEIIQWSDDCDDTTSEKPDIVYLPPVETPSPIFANYAHPSGQYYFLTTISGIGPEGSPDTSDPDNSYNVWDEDWPGYCVDEVGKVKTNFDYRVEMWSSYSEDPDMPYPDQDWPKVNWIINNMDDYPTALYTDFQDAIWYFINGGQEPGTSMGQQIRDDAAMHPDFVPSEGELIAILLWPVDENWDDAMYNADTPVQKTFIIIDP